VEKLQSSQVKTSRKTLSYFENCKNIFANLQSTHNAEILWLSKRSRHS